MKVIYLAGPMSNIPHFNFPAFARAAEYLRSAGHFVFNPAERDMERHGGVDISEDNPTGDIRQAENDHGFDRRVALADDTQFICLKATAIALLPGWDQSSGAIAELALAKALGHEIMYLPV